MRKIIVAGLLCVFLSACGKKAELDDSVGDSVESAVTTVGGILDEQSGGGFAVESTEATFAVCSGRAVDASCSGAIRSASYAGCSLGLGLFTLTGSVSLTYSSDAICTAGLGNVGDYVIRTYDLAVMGPRGGTLRRFTSAHTDYEGDSISGGGKLTRTAGGYQVEVLGNTRVLSVGGTDVFDISVRTTSPISATGLPRASRTLNGGALEIIHNLAEYTATWVPANLSWSAGCCYPTSGSATISFSGSKSGTATVQFTGCGAATVSNEDGATKELTFTNCE